MSKRTSLQTRPSKKVDGAENNESRTNEQMLTSKYLSFTKSFEDNLSKRDYGFFKASRGSTHFPHAQSPMTDLEDESKSQMSTRKSSDITFRSMSIILTREKLPSSVLGKLKQESDSQMDIAEEPSSPHSEPVLTFEMRRKLFDRAEFTICKGRKITDTFHGVIREKSASARRDSKFEERNTYGNLKELEAFCKANNFNMIKGFPQ